MRTLVRVRGKAPIRSKCLYYLMLAGFWGYTILWFAVPFYVYLVWEPSALYKVLAFVAWILLTPSPKDLFCSYSTYLKDFEGEEEEKRDEQKYEPQGS